MVIMVEDLMKKTFSVLINNYNYGKYLEDCLDSVLSQDYENLEIIIYDDGSTDSSRKILKKYKNRVISILAENYGSSPNKNQANGIYQAFLRSTGEWILLLDSDDIFLEGKLASISASVSENPQAILIQHYSKEIDDKMRFTGSVRPFLAKLDINAHVHRTHNLLFLFAQTSGLTFSRKYLAKALPLSEDSRELLWPDVRLTRGAIGLGEIVTIRKPLGGYRVHCSNDSAKLSDRKVLLEAIRQQYSYFNELQLVRAVPEIMLPEDYASDIKISVGLKLWSGLKMFGVGNIYRYFLFRLLNAVRSIIVGVKNAKKN